jgi:predicted DNA-binding transcriptional regulator AlpA
MKPELTVPDILENLGISRATFNRLKDSDPTFRTYKVGGLVRMRPADLEHWKEIQVEKQNPPVLKYNKRVA